MSSHVHHVGEVGHGHGVAHHHVHLAHVLNILAGESVGTEKMRFGPTEERPQDLTKLEILEKNI